MDSTRSAAAVLSNSGAGQVAVRCGEVMDHRQIAGDRRTSRRIGRIARSRVVAVLATIMCATALLTTGGAWAASPQNTLPISIKVLGAGFDNPDAIAAG